jgi:virginiamycin B lyase
MKAMQAALIGTIAACAMAGCASQNGATVPGTVAYTTLRNVINDKRGRVTLYPDVYADPIPAAIATGPDGQIWFTDTANAVIGRITTDGKYTLQMRVSGVSDGITTGPDGNLWFTGSNASGPAIGRITRRGAVKYFADTGGSGAQGITTGSDGALWFAESNGTVGRMTTKGKVTHFTVAPSDAFLQGIVAGPDGNLWVTWYVVGGSHFANHVIRLTTRGKSTSFTVGYGPDFICAGSDQALWFTEASTNAIGRLTINGKYTAFPTNYEYAQPSGIAAGLDGALWFTDFSGRAGIGRMTMSGKTRYYKVPGSLPELVEITAGPDGNMWFTSDLVPSGIGRVIVH